MNRKLIFITAAMAAMLSSTPIVAQAPATTAKQSVGPTVTARTVGIRAPSAASATANRTAAADTHMGAGQNVALMVVGGAALIIGAVIGGTAGILLAVGGAAIGLYGLYRFIQ